MTFHLVPEQAWTAGKPRLEKALPEGEVYLYREGGNVPELVAKAGEPLEVPAGRWVWIAEAPGYVSVETGLLSVVRDSPEVEPRNIVWAVVPACRVRLNADPRWSGLQRLDVISLSRGSTHPIHPLRRREIQVPAGDLIVYSVGSRGLVGMERLGPCKHAEEIVVEPPAPPGPGRQSLMASFQAPEGQPRVGAELAVGLQSAGSSIRSGRGPSDPPVLPSAVIRPGNRAVFFFLDVPAEGALEVVARHPLARTAVLELEGLGGSVRDLGLMELEPRRAVAFQVEYRPRRDHRSAVVDLLYCGRRDRIPRYLEGCVRNAEPVHLTAGLQEVRFTGLDDGKYVPVARVDDEVVSGFGSGFYPYLAPGDESVPRPEQEPLRLWELEIHGHILEDGEAVPGAVVLLPGDPSQPVRRFATDEELEYHMYFFGRQPLMASQVPTEARGGETEDILGLYLLTYYQIAACDQDGFCTFFNPHSLLVGEGRLDLPLGPRRRLEVTVTDAESGEPVEGADVGVPEDRRTLRFVHGKLSWGKPVGKEPSVARTDAKGQARLRLPRTERDWVTVLKDGYETYNRSLDLPAEGSIRLRVELQPVSEGGSALLTFRDGPPLSGAALLAFGRNGSPDYSCHVGTTMHGTVEIPERCMEARTFVVIHPQARITLLDSRELAASGHVSIERAPSRPLVVQVMDEAGRPLPGVPVELHYRGLTLGANEILAAASFCGSVLFYVSDGNGRLVLQGVDPSSPDVLSLEASAGVRSGKTDLAGYSPGDTVVLQVETSR